LGIGDLGFGGWAQDPKPTTQTPKPKTKKQSLKKKNKFF